MPAADADVTDDREPGVNAHPDSQGETSLQPKLLVQLVDRLHDAQGCANRSLGVVFVGVWITEVDEHSVAEILRYVAVESGDRAPARALVGGNGLGKLLGIELLGQFRGADEVAEHHGELPALGPPARGEGRRQLEPATGTERRVPRHVALASRTLHGEPPVGCVELSPPNPEGQAIPWTARPPDAGRWRCR
jgi:hypothetical protein